MTLCYLCAELECLKNGTFNTGTEICDCPTGFTGSNCSGKMSSTAALAWYYISFMYPTRS